MVVTHCLLHKVESQLSACDLFSPPPHAIINQKKKKTTVETMFFLIMLNGKDLILTRSIITTNTPQLMSPLDRL